MARGRVHLAAGPDLCLRGKVEDTLPVTELPDKIALQQLDTDWYLSTKEELETMWVRLSPGGLQFIDDYCAWALRAKAESGRTE